MNSFQHSFQGERPGVGHGGGGFDKSLLLAEYAERFHVKTVVETGLYQGRGSGMGIAGVAYVAIDWQQSNLDLAREAKPEGAYLHGDSAAVLAAELPVWQLATPVLFWLDAHALTEDEGSPTVCPVLGELAAIKAWQHAASSVVLIDDLWAMGSLRGWPTLDELHEAADGVWDTDEAGGVLRLTPKP